MCHCAPDLFTGTPIYDQETFNILVYACRFDDEPCGLRKQAF